MMKIKKTLSIPHTLVCGLLGFLDDPKLKTFKYDYILKNVVFNLWTLEIVGAQQKFREILLYSLLPQIAKF